MYIKPAGNMQDTGSLQALIILNKQLVSVWKDINALYSLKNVFLEFQLKWWQRSSKNMESVLCDVIHSALITFILFMKQM